MSFSALRRRRPTSEINVTPFVDVMLVLLVIFMVTAPLLYQGVDVNLPETNTQPLRLQNEPLVLSVQKNGDVFIGRKTIALDELKPKLEALFESRDSTELFLRADREAPYGLVVRAIAAARQAGSTRMGIVTEAER
ncbi:MAG: biopolymer transporter ExbD [Myxococcota bacterium]|nr:biopolymer transporter ExbD [Myxococcota bacterium]